MSKIRILPEHLANRIAAGEVVERPASVVKELVENSLDAGADRIEIEVEGGGTRLLRIIDNGEGMDEDDILLCLERHGTSKIREDHDLDAISTLGFRGEALPSIASVAKMAIISRTRDSALGTMVTADYGRLLKVEETGCRRGTVLEVRHLFGNTPARRKFLRTARTELGHIDEAVKNCALSSPAVAFILRIDGKETLHLDGGAPLARRLADILHYHGDFIAVGTGGRQRSERSVSGLLVPPEAAISAAAGLRLFVNGRAVKDRMMAHAAAEGLRGFLMKGRNPAGMLHLSLPADEVDVNVHPAKHEVRFRNTAALHEMIRQEVEAAVVELQRSIRQDVFTLPESRGASDRPLYSAPAPTPRPAAATPPRPQRLYTLPPERNDADVGTTLRAPFPAQLREPEAEEESGTTDRAGSHSPGTPHPAGERGHGLEVIGQFRDLYILCRSGDNLVVIDQHAAHERLLFERLRAQFLQGKVASQQLLFPMTVELSRFQSRLVDENGERIANLGFTVRPFGGNTHIISAVPAIAGQCDPGGLLLDILERFGGETGADSPAGRLDDVLAAMACKAAVRSGDTLQPPEIEALLQQMAAADLFTHCPHGRPVIKILPATEIKRWFSRP